MKEIEQLIVSLHCLSGVSAANTRHAPVSQTRHFYIIPHSHIPRTAQQPKTTIARISNSFSRVGASNSKRGMWGGMWLGGSAPPPQKNAGAF
jgi:hypothetical protein